MTENKIYRIYHFVPQNRRIVERAIRNPSLKSFDIQDGEITSARFGCFSGPAGLYLNIEGNNWGISPVMTNTREISGLLKRLNVITPAELKRQTVSVYFIKEKGLALGFSVNQ